MLILLLKLHSGGVLGREIEDNRKERRCEAHGTGGKACDYAKMSRVGSLCQFSVLGREAAEDPIAVEKAEVDLKVDQESNPMMIM